MHLAFLIFVLLITLLVSLVTGVLSLSELLRHPDFFYILLHLRLPRTLLALLSGCSLGMVGAVLQTYFKNPLAEAGLLGLSSVGALGAVIGIMASFSPPLLAFLGAALLGSFYILYPPRSPSTLLLTGIGVGTIASALMSLLFYLSKDPYGFLNMMQWLFGRFSMASLDQVLWIMPPILTGVLILCLIRHPLTFLVLGVDMAAAQGVNLKNLGRWMMLSVTLIIGPLVALTGVIGFIGLIAPHICRPFTGNLPKHLLVPAGLVGGALALIADILARLLSPEPSIAVLTALIGAPVFLYLLKKG